MRFSISGLRPAITILFVAVFTLLAAGCETDEPTATPEASPTPTPNTVTSIDELTAEQLQCIDTTGRLPELREVLEERSSPTKLLAAALDGCGVRITEEGEPLS